MPIDLINGNNEILNNYNAIHVDSAYLPESNQHSPPSRNGLEHRDAAMTVAQDTGYVGLAKRIEEEIQAVRQRAAARFLPALKAEMQRRPHETYDQKIELVRWVNAELRRFNMAFKHPKTGQPAAFYPSPGNHPDIGAFQLDGKDAGGKRTTITTPDLAALLDKLELMDAPIPRNALSEWQDRVGRPGRAAKRG
jgi:hypothetical protein